MQSVQHSPSKNVATMLATAQLTAADAVKVSAAGNAGNVAGTTLAAGAVQGVSGAVSGGVAGAMTVGQSPAISYQPNPGQIAVTTPTAATLTPSQQALVLQSLSPPQQPVTPQAHLQSLTPQHQALNPVNLAAMTTPTGPAPLPGTPSHGAVITVNTPNQATLPLNGQGQFFGYQNQHQSPHVGALQQQVRACQHGLP